MLIRSTNKTHYHGGPMWGNVDIGPKKIWCGDILYKNSCALVSYARPEQLKRISKICNSLVLDNGAFSAWRKQQKQSDAFDWVSHWAGYYCWVLANYSKIDWFIIPDVIEGSEEENDKLIDELPSSLVSKAVPVWHSVESLDRLSRLCRRFPRVAIGLCGEHTKTTSNAAQVRLFEAFERIYINESINVKIHGLRMLDGRVLGRFPFDSGDSSFVAVNVPKTKSQMKEVQCKLARTAIYKSKIESVTPPTIADWVYENSKMHLLLL